MDTINSRIAEKTKIPLWKVENTVRLLDEGATIPFIARYRKEATGELDEIQVSEVEELLKHYRALESRKAEVIRLIEEQGKLTDELREQITAAANVTAVEDLYRPYRPKRTTRASLARERGLEPLAEYLLSFPASGSVEAEGEKYISEQVPSSKDALQGAMDIIAESVSDDPAVRGWVRDHTRRNGTLVARAREPKEDSLYRNYDSYRSPVPRVAPHQVMAINRGEKADYLTVGVEVEPQEIIEWLYRRFLKEGVTGQYVKTAIDDSYGRLVAPAVERDIRGELTERGEGQAIQVFARNLRGLLMQRPVKDRVVLGIDPGQRTGSKFAVVDELGRVLEVGVVYPIPPHNRVEEAVGKLKNAVEKHQVTGIAIGNGTGSRQVEQFTVGFLKKLNRPGLVYTIVSEAGASVYSASKLAAQEFPDLDLSLRSAVSIARRLQDPLSELVKIPPRSIGVGQYQHDLPPRQLDQSLETVVELCVNAVGVDLNTASAALLGYVAGLNSTQAESIVKFRHENGRFKTRDQIKKVPRIGPRSFEQAAGFLRVSDPVDPLDSTAVHPESYKLARALLEQVNSDSSEIGTPALKEKLKGIDIERAAARLGAGVPTTRDIVDSLLRPGRDPREDLPPPVFRTDVIELEDLKVGMEMPGKVISATDWGVYVDIGVKINGMVHVSQISDRFVKHPLDVVSVGDIVKVRVINVDLPRKRVGLSMKGMAPGNK